MRKIMAIIPAAVLTIGATTMGVLANTASAEKSNISVDYMSAFSKGKEQTAEKLSTSVVNFQADSRGYFIDSNNDGVCDNYADGVCPGNGTGNGIAVVTAVVAEEPEYSGGQCLCGASVR